MRDALKTVLICLLNRRHIGGKHTPEDQLINSKLKWIDKKDRKEFEREYRELINQEIIIRVKKRTGKGSEWHISINPQKIKEVYNILEIEEGI